MLDGFFQGVFKSFDHLVPSPVGDTQLYYPLGMGLGDKIPFKHSKPSSISGDFVLVLWEQVSIMEYISLISFSQLHKTWKKTDE